MSVPKAAAARVNHPRRYDHAAIEAKWQRRWAAERRYETPDGARRRPYYCLDMFPYPSGAGLHVGHPRGYVATDVVSRLKRAQGFTVLHPMGWDAFGLPAENYAIKTGVHPRETTQSSIERFRHQIQSIGLSYDWSREINTSDPSYYRWTQWLFLKLYEHDLAYQKEAPVNWCPQDQTVLANEQVVNGSCERCGTPVEQRNLKQWFFRITRYADELLQGLDALNWPESIKAMQRNWIGRSEGMTVAWKIVGGESLIETFTTRPDTLYGVTYLVLAPDHPLVELLHTRVTNAAAVQTYVEATRHRSEVERRANEKSKSGVPLEGVVAVHPLTGEHLPVWIADYVLMGYGTGAVMAVPAHDERDWQFAATHHLPVTWVIESPSTDRPWTEQGTVINSASWNGLHSTNDRAMIIISLIKRGVGEQMVTYRLRDWLVSRQRYWGAPIPMLYCERCGVTPVPEADLPVLLPNDVDFTPTGESPLARSASYRTVNCSACLGSAIREVDTMDTFVDSSWYFLRYLNPSDTERAIDPEKIKQWLPVDLYVGGAEHAILHLLYARFITKALADILTLPVREPFQRLVNVGLVRANDGRKMSKSLGNVINPDDVVRQYGADTLRCYELFMGPFSDSMPWNTRSMVGVRRWLDRVWNLRSLVRPDATTPPELARIIERTITRVTSDIEQLHLNTAISALMECTNALIPQPAISAQPFQRFLSVLAPFAPHLAEELWEQLAFTPSITSFPWPEPDASVLQAETESVAYVLQIGGKTRGTFTASPTADEAALIATARAHPAAQRHLAGAPQRTVVVPGKLVNLIP